MYTYTTGPTVTAVSPTTGPLGGATSVTITGTNLTGASAVKFGSTAATSFTVTSATSITATSPAGSAGAVDITVTSAGGTSPTGSADQFTYAAPTVIGVSPSTGPPPPPSPGAAPSPPLVTVGPPVVNGQAAGFSGSVNPNGLATSTHFEYGLDPKYTGGGPIVYTDATPTVALGAGSAAVPVSQSVSGLVPFAVYHVRLVAVNAAGTVTGPDQPLTTAKLPNPPPPVLGQDENAMPISGLVFIKFPAGKGPHLAGVVKGQGFIPLTQARQVPVGSQIDARRGTLNLVVATTKRHRTNTARLAGGLFSLAQQRTGPSKGVSTLALLENAFPGAPSYSTCTTKKTGKSVLAGIAKLNPKILQTLSVSDNNGKFRTKGRYSAATERGTSWATEDRCDGTLTIVKRGTVNVQDFHTRKTVIVRAGHSFLASAAITNTKPKKKKKKKK
jgi:hypothetical protein